MVACEAALAAKERAIKRAAFNRGHGRWSRIPNVGKSTLLTRLVGKKNAVTGTKPGVTKPAVVKNW